MLAGAEVPVTVRPDLSLVLVTHFSSAVLPICIGSFRRETELLGLGLEIVVVDHSEDSVEHQTLAAADCDLFLPCPNRGYAAGLNAGVAAASAPVLLLANPDIELLPGGLAPLLSQLQPAADAAEPGFAVVGPQLVWDSTGRLLLPVPDDPAPQAELDRLRGRYHHPHWERTLPGHLEQSWRLWSADNVLPVPCLRGPLLVLSRDSWQQFGPMDEGYFLYYEETEWLYRASRQGARFGLAGNARVVHRWGHATARRPDRDRIELASRRRFFARNYPRQQHRELWRQAEQEWHLQDAETRRTPAEQPGVAAAAVLLGGPQELPAGDADLWLVSPFPHLQPAAGWLDDERGAPAELARLTGSGRWYAAAASRRQGEWEVTGSWYWGEP